ncbi:MAG: hypothetical protein JNJ55_00955 [Betaproteobacteria bacterium]|nr:hypothetical protein [Betaproteobacteria bacterium]
MILTTWPFLLSLSVLLVNDWYLKAAFPGVVTGKLSDFAGIAVVALLLLAAAPRHRRPLFWGIALAFLWWKSPASEPFIRAINGVGLVRIGRTVDYTDLIALLVVPLCQRVVTLDGKLTTPSLGLRRLLVIPTVAATSFALLGTSVIQTRQDYSVRKTTSADELKREEVAEVIKTVGAKHGLECRRCALPTERAELEGTGMTLAYSFMGKNAVLFKVFALPNGLFFGASGQQKADALRADLKAEFAKRFRDLEYVEQLTAKE